MKEPLRRTLLQRRLALSAEERRRQSRAIVDRLDRLALDRGARTVLGYWPLVVEVDATEYLHRVSREGRRVALPRVEGSRLVLHAWVPGDELERGPYGLREPSPTAPPVAPAEVDLALVPGVAFDVEGHRLGFGMGFYDRLLGAVPQGGRVGLAFDLQVVDRLPAEGHDVAMGWVVTPSAAKKTHS